MSHAHAYAPHQTMDPIEPLPVGDLLWRSVARFPRRPAMSFMGRHWRYDELAALVQRATAGLQRLGVRKGDRVGLCLPNTPYFVVFYYAALQAGAIVVNFNPLYVVRELAHQIADSGTTTMIVPDLAAIYGKVAEAGASTGLKQIVVCPMAGALPPAKALLWRTFKRRETAHPPRGNGVTPYAEIIADHGRRMPVEIDPEKDIAVLQYTGGTTGVPKGAMLTHANLSINAMQVRHHMPSLADGEERIMGVLPFFHVFAMTAVMNCGVALGAELQLHPRFEIGAVMRALAHDKPTVLHAVPTIYTAIAAAAERHRIDISSVRACISGGAPLPAEVRARFEQLTGARLVEGYGLTEASPVVACNPPDATIKDGTVGVAMRATHIEIRALDAPHALLPANARGEICVRGPQVMRGYWNRPNETAAAFIEGALRTGDIGQLDEDGYLSVTDRLKDIIICGGYNVYPRTIEDALYEHPSVAEAIVIGVPDAYRGQAPVAFVTLRPGHGASPEELKAFLGTYVSRIEQPREIEIRDTLPKTMIGKLSRKELVAEYAQSRHS